MKLADVDQKKLLPLLESLAGAVEELLLTGLTTASEATRRTLDISFQEASRMRLLRLGSTLRVANQELGRFTQDDPEFSKRRLSFFLNRTWLLSRGLVRALREQDEDSFSQLLFVPQQEAVNDLEVVTIGVAKKHVKDTFCSFDFHLRTINKTQQIPSGASLVWSCVFPLKPGSEIPPEGFLHLPQKQKFKPHVLLEGQVVKIDSGMIAQAAGARRDCGVRRLTLTENSKVSAGEAFADWPELLQWEPAGAAERVREYQPGPFDLEVELQEEVILHDWEFLPNEPETLGDQVVYPIAHRGTRFDLIAAASSEGDTVREAVKSLAKKKARPPLFGLMHYQMCRLALQPLTIFEKGAPKHLMISSKNIDRKALLQAIKF